MNVKELIAEVLSADNEEDIVILKRQVLVTLYQVEQLMHVLPSDFLNDLRVKYGLEKLSEKSKEILNNCKQVN